MANVKINVQNIQKLEVMNFQNGKTAKDIVEEYKPDYLLNLGLYDMSTKTPLTKVKDENKSYGYLFSDLGFGIDNNKIEWANKNGDHKDFISGSPTLVVDGKKKIDWGNKYSEYVDGVHYRSVLGIDDNHIYLLATDSKSSLSKLVDTSLKLGMKYAINLDGGGSCCLYAKDRYLRYSIRANTSWLLVWLKDYNTKNNDYNNAISSYKNIANKLK